MTQRTGALECSANEYLEINCADAEKAGVCDGDKNGVISRRGQVELAASCPKGYPGPGVHVIPVPGCPD